MRHFGVIVVVTLAAVACSEPTGELPDRTVTEPTFRKAIPSRTSVAIDFQRRLRHHLEPVSPQYESLELHVAKINGTIDAVFDDLGQFSQLTPEVLEARRARWRKTYVGLAGHDEVLEISTEDGWEFVLAYDIGPAGFAPDASSPLTATVVLDENDTIDAFDITLDFDALRRIEPTSNIVGKLLVALQPSSGKTREIWYDLAGLGTAGGVVETSRTTYWAFGASSGGLEYVGQASGEEQTAYARWDGRGGRLDYYARVETSVVGPLDLLGSNCWGVSTQELFDGFAMFTTTSDVYVHVDGIEASCVHAPLDGHPMPDGEFDALPEQGDWDVLEMNGAPFCEDQPDDPECIYYCDVFAC